MQNEEKCLAKSRELESFHGSFNKGWPFAFSDSLVSLVNSIYPSVQILIENPSPEHLYEHFHIFDYYDDTATEDCMFVKLIISKSNQK